MGQQTTMDQKTTLESLIDYLIGWVRACHPSMTEASAKNLRTSYYVALRDMPEHLAKKAVERTVKGHRRGVPKPADVTEHVKDELRQHYAAMNPATTALPRPTDGIPMYSDAKSRRFADLVLNGAGQEAVYARSKTLSLIAFGYLERNERGEIVAGPKLGVG